MKKKILLLALLVTSFVPPAFADGGSCSFFFPPMGSEFAATRTTGDHTKRIIGYVTQWDAWKSTEPVCPTGIPQSPQSRLLAIHPS